MPAIPLRFRSAPTIHKQAFTLVELLVVVTIFTILLALLLPTVRSAIMTSRNVVCMNNHRNIGMLFGIYANDYTGLYPTGDYPGWRPGAWELRDWTWQLFPYILPGYEQYPSSALFKIYNGNGTFRCPQIFSIKSASLTAWSICHYGAWATLVNRNFTQVRVQNVGTPSGNIALIDAGRIGFVYYSFKILSSDHSELYFEHVLRAQRMTNCLYVDGHVATRSELFLNETCNKYPYPTYPDHGYGHY